jgi:hypothetical protein
LLVELNNSAGERKKRIVFGPADITARMKTGAALPYDDATGPDRLTTEYFHA